MIDSLSNASYLNHLNQHELMTAQDELELGRQVQQGCFQARSEFIERNLKLVISIAGRYRGRGLDVADLVEEGNLGLMRAVDKYDPEMGYRFSTYAAWWIRQAVERALMNQAKTVRTPIHKQREIRQERKARELENETYQAMPNVTSIIGSTPLSRSFLWINPLRIWTEPLGSIYWSLMSPHRRLRSSVNKTVKMLPLG